MATATEDRIRACLIREGVCEDEVAQRLAAVIAEEIATGDQARVTHDQLAMRIAQLEHQMWVRDFESEMEEIVRLRDERQRERDQQERARGERTRQYDPWKRD